MANQEGNIESKGIKKGWFNAGLIAIGAAITLPIVIIIFSKTKFTTEKIGHLGPVGDFLGGSTIGLLSIASIFFIIHTIRIQSTELSLQREELTLTRNELEKTREVHELSHNTMIKQQFENTFFNMLSLHNEIVNSIHFVEGGTIYNGRAIFKRLIQYMENKLKRIDESPNKNHQFGRLVNLEEAVSTTAKDFSENTSHYFKNLYTLLMFLDQEEALSQNEKDKYSEIIKSQLSPYELVYLMYLSFRTENITFLELTKKYNFFYEVDKDLLLRHDDYGLYCNFHIKLTN
ncbi:putative phage abortive infection protein [Pseudobacillus badius]|uniref:putative phage abortive infection protein n=1 Tax=Bacillus badius TaxID=1455 RepID=UPI003CE91CD9